MIYLKAMNHDIYICYTEQDKAIAEEICQAMEQQEIFCWLNSRNIDFNKPFARSVIKAINDCKCVIVIMSTYANESSQVEYEIDLAYKNKKIIVPFLIENITTNPIFKYYFSTNILDNSCSNSSCNINDLVKYVCGITGKIYRDNAEEQQELVPYASNGKMGFVDKDTMEIVIPCRFKSAIKFVGSYGVILEKGSPYWYLINRKGEILKDYALFEFEKPWDSNCFDSLGLGIEENIYEDFNGIGFLNNFHNGYIIVCKGGHKWGIMEVETLNEVTTFNYDHIYCGEHFFISVQDDKLGVIDFHGKEMSKCIYDRINLFANFYHARKNIKCVGYNDISKGVLLNYKLVNQYRAVIYNNQKAFKKFINEDSIENIINANLGDSITHFFDINGNFICEKFTTIQDEREEFDCYQESLFQFDDKYESCNFFKSNIYSKIQPFSEGVASVCKDGLWGYINLKGEEIIPCNYWEAYNFSEGLALVVKRFFPSKLKFGFIDKFGNEVIPCKYDYARDFSEGLASVCLNGKWGFIDKKGQLIIPLTFSYAESFSDGLSLVVNTDIIQEPEYDYKNKTFSNFDYRSKDVKYGFIDKAGQLVIPFIYEKPAAYVFSPSYSDKTIPTKFQEGIIKVFKNKEWGIIDNTGKEIVAFGRYQSIEDLKNGLLEVCKNGQYGLINFSGNIIVPIGKYSSIGDFENGLATVYEGNYRCGIINNLGIEIVPCKYEEINIENDGFIVASSHGNIFYYDSNGQEFNIIEYHKKKQYLRHGIIPINGGAIDIDNNLIIPTKYDNIREYGVVHNYENTFNIADIINKGVLYVYQDGVIPIEGYVDQFGNDTLKTGQGLAPCIFNKKFGYSERYIFKKYSYYGVDYRDVCEAILQDNRVQFKYDRTYNIVNGFGRVQINNKWGFVNTLGREIVPCKYTNVKDFHQGRAAVLTQKGWGFVNVLGEEIIPCQYDNVIGFANGLSVVYKNGKSGCINRIGQVVIPIEYENIDYLSESFIGVKMNGKWGFIDTANNNVVPFIYDEISAFNNGIARVKYGKDYLFINTKGEEFDFHKYNVIRDFSENLALVIKGGKYSWINKDEELLLPFNYTHAESFKDGIARVGFKQKYGYIDKEGNEIIPLEFDDTWRVGTNLIAVKQNDKCALMNLNGNLLTKYKYDTIYRFHNGVACVQEKGRWSFINENGKPITGLVFEEVYGFYNGFGAVKLGENLYELIDKFGNISNFGFSYKPI